MKKSIWMVLLCGVFALSVMAVAPQPAFAQRGGGGHFGGGGGGFHGGGGGFHGGGGHPGFSGGGFRGGYGSGFRGNGFYGGRGYGGRGYGGRGYGGRGYGWRGGWGYPRWGWGGGWGWGLGFDIGFGWGPYWGWDNPYWAWGGPYGYGYPYWGAGYDAYDGYDDGYAPPYDYSRPCRSRDNGDREDYRHEPASKQNSQGSANSGAGVDNEAFSGRSVEDYRHETITPVSSSNMLLVNSTRHPLRRQVLNAIQALRAMPPQARQRMIESGKYDAFSAEERQILMKAADVPVAQSSGLGPVM